MRIAGPMIFAALALAGCSSVQGPNGAASPVPHEETSRIQASPALSPDAERQHAVDQLVGRWVYEVCDADGNCETVVRVYEETPEDGLVRYTELYNGTENEGFVDYDIGRDSFAEIDYPQDWDRYEFERRYRSEDTAIRLFGEAPFGGPEDRTLQWHLSENRNTMTLRTGVGDITEEPHEFLDVIFSRVPLIGTSEDSN